MATMRSRDLAIFLATNLVLIGFCSVKVDADGPNRVTRSDVAAGRWMDSLLDPDLQPSPKVQQPHRRPRKSASRSKSNLRGKLVKNPNVGDGSPGYALVDQHGGVLRYVEPVDSVNLKNYLGKAVSVRHDTGDILLASQLALPRSTTRREPAGLQLAQNLEPIPAGESVAPGEIVGESTPIVEHDNGPIYLEGEYDSGLNFGDCPNCGDVTCGRRCGACGFGSRGVFYAHAEYLHWWFEGMETPPLVIQFQDLDIPTGQAIEPINTIFGGTPLFEDARNGGRLTLGLWLDDYGQWAIEGDYLEFGTEDLRFSAGIRDGQVPPLGSFIGRPFFNTGVIGGDLTTRGPSQQDVDTNRLDGSVTVTAFSEFRSGGIRLRHNLCCREGCQPCCGDGVGCGGGVGCGLGVGCGSGVGEGYGPLQRLVTLLTKGTRRHDVLYGVRWASLDEGIRVVEDLQEVVSGVAVGNEIDVFDDFTVENEFFGGEIGYETDWQQGRWSLNFLSKIAIGNTRQLVQINGATTIDDGLGAVETTAGGLLTQDFDHPDGFNVGNIGNFERDEFSVLPEIGVTLGYNLTRSLKLTGGYTLLYWSNVVRPGEQIDLDVNGNLLRRNGVPDPTTIVQGDHPRFVFRQTDLWAHGFNLGAEYTW